MLSAAVASPAAMHRVSLADEDDDEEAELLDVDDEPELDEDEEEIELLRAENMADALEEKIRGDYALNSLADITMETSPDVSRPSVSPHNTATDEDCSSASSVDGHHSSDALLSPARHAADSPSSSSAPAKPKPTSSRPPHEKKHKCETCGKCFSYLSILESHKRSHTGEKPFNCRFCEKKFAQKATLQVHERTHTGERPYKCRYCEKTFAQYGTKTVHEKSAHLGIRNYKCPLCEKNLSSPSALYTHKKTHGEKIFQCEFCTKTFTLKNYLKLHVKQVHEQNERKHACHFCTKSFAYAGSLQVHIRTHTGERPYACKFCPKAFASQGNLQSHERTHTGERPYACKQCERTFIQKSQLTAHEATHSNAAPNAAAQPAPPKKASNAANFDHTCAHCGKRFAFASSLYVHMAFSCPFCGKAVQKAAAGEKPFKCAGCGKAYAQKIGLKPHWEQCALYKALHRETASESPINVETDSDGTFEESPRKDSVTNIYAPNFDTSQFSLPLIPPSPMKVQPLLPPIQRPIPIQLPPANYGPMTASKPPFGLECLPDSLALASLPSMQSATATIADALSHQSSLPPTPVSAPPPLDPALLASLLSNNSPSTLQLLLQLHQTQTESLLHQFLLSTLQTPSITSPLPLLNIPQFNSIASVPQPSMKADTLTAASALLQLSGQTSDLMLA